MIYDIDGNLLSSGGENLDGYTMETAPGWTDSKLIYSDSATLAPGTLSDASSVLAASDYIPVRGRNTLKITLINASDTKPTAYGLCFYDANKEAMKNYATNSFWGRGTGDPRAIVAEVIVPEHAEFFRTTYWSASAMESYPETPAFTYTFTPGRFSESAITEERPTNRGMENAIRRARQLTDLKWTPLVKVPRYCQMNGSTVHFLDWCESGEEYTGVPYSGSGQGETWQEGVIDPTKDAGKWGYYQFWVGLEITPETFVTAARYPNSIMGTRASRTTANYDASIYGDVCTALVSYALGLTTPIWSINGFCTSASYGKDYFNTLGVLGTDIQLADIRLGDVFHNNTHIAIITDITRAADGSITGVEISEATTIGNANNAEATGWKLGGFCRRKTWPAASLMTSYWVNEYTMYRYKNFTGISYTRSQYVDTGRELNCLPIVDYPCIPYLGNRARYKAGYIYNSKVLIGATGFTTLVVTKDGSSFGSFTLNNATEIDVGFSATGSYEAHLTGSNNKRSASCYWTVE